ncbi:hypothetical protein LTR56_021342 [Elasticomyces elasticus]|nr:hypothetical protein LTR56_021342 [Elasticomyces elasticus]KAK3631683.1 hypothetical protein LTR22_020973 [Elasticomyces elasticus]KAK4909558.1 hypothetical protein LTR49_021675 [Elasticomyces elasticus]KAK5754331.1 hypothetical protein LTS12_015622 [Elasticomyces elasticus]
MSLLSSLFLRKAPQIPSITLPFTALNNPYTARHAWPPNFTLLSERHKFRLERRYRRRTQLKWARPQWKKFVTLAQWASILWVCGYGVLYLDMGEKGTTVVDKLREWWVEGGENETEVKTVAGELALEGVSVVMVILKLSKRIPVTLAGAHAHTNQGSKQRIQGTSRISTTTTITSMPLSILW